jgi:small subunit ribosomal protein S20
MVKSFDTVNLKEGIAMPNIKSAIKRVKVTEKKTLRNRMVYHEMMTAVKKFKKAVASNDAEGAEQLLSAAFSEIDAAAFKGVIHKNNAARKKAGLSGRLRDLKSGKLVVVAKVDTKARAAAKAAAQAAERDRLKREAAEKAAAKAAKDEKPVKEKKAKKEKADEKAEKPAKEKAEKSEKPAKEKAEKADKADKAEKPAKEKAAKDEK